MLIQHGEDERLGRQIKNLPLRENGGDAGIYQPVASGLGAPLHAGGELVNT